MLFPSYLMGGEFSAFENILRQRALCERHFSSGELIHAKDQQRQQLSCYLISGVLNTRLVHESGKYTELTVREAGAMFPLFYSSQLTASGRVTEAVAATECDVLYIKKREIQSLICEIPAFAIAMIDAYVKLSNLLECALESRLHDPLQKRISDFLVLHMNNDGDIAMTQEGLANALGASRSKTAEALSRLRKKGILETQRGRIVVVDYNRLLDECSYSVKVG